MFSPTALLAGPPTPKRHAALPLSSLRIIGESGPLGQAGHTHAHSDHGNPAAAWRPRQTATRCREESVLLHSTWLEPTSFPIQALTFFCVPTSPSAQKDVQCVNAHGTGKRESATLAADRGLKPSGGLSRNRPPSQHPFHLSKKENESTSNRNAERVKRLVSKILHAGSLLLVETCFYYIFVCVCVCVNSYMCVHFCLCICMCRDRGKSSRPD